MNVGSFFSGIGGLDYGLHQAGFTHEFFFASPDSTAAKSSLPGGPEFPSTRTYALSENGRNELRLTNIAPSLSKAGGKPGQGYSAVVTLDSSAAASLAKTYPWLDAGPDSQVTDPGCSMSSPGSSRLFDPDGFSSRTFPVSSLQMAVGTSEQSLERWPTSGTAWVGGFSTAVSSECRSDDGGCSSSEPALTEILDPPHAVPVRYSLSARAATGILRRAQRRGRELPPHLLSALSLAAASQADGESEPTKQQEAS